jgi:hypothetical protein
VVRNLSLLAALLAASAAGCSSDTIPDVLHVPGEFSTIQSAVDAARSGDTIQLDEGTYVESVVIRTASIVLRGVDRNTVIINGRHRLANGISVAANDVRIENLTVHSFTQNGIIFNGYDAVDADADPDLVGTKGHSLVGYEVRWVTAYNNGLYGIYAFAASDGLIENSLVSGHPDSGIYIGQCKPCRVIVRNVIAEFNAIGYYGTNASGDVYVVESRFRNNRLGIAPNSQRSELLFPQEETYIAGNLVHDNDDPRAPAIMDGFSGGGIIVGGGTRNLILRNRVVGHDYVGIGLIDFNGFVPMNNEVRENAATNNGTDLAFVDTSLGANEGNCFAANIFGTAFPSDLQDFFGCPAVPRRSPTGNLPAPTVPPDIDYRYISVPPAQPAMPVRLLGEPTGAAPFAAPDLSAVKLPAPTR